ncbi:MAG TPA: IPT/TIG domain-containing protein [Pyrinomonadaceae bacterium]|nr:IPT/TIG domain-containing protein [Pyrinomonadaceae bacterium]
MAVVEGTNQSERNKKIAAIVLGSIALIALVYMFLGPSSSGPKRPTNSNTRTTASATPASRLNVPSPSDYPDDNALLQPIFLPEGPPVVPEAGRNIFAFYVPPVKPTPDPNATPVEPTPEPAPQPNVILAGISPVNVYAHTGDFTLDVTGDKFTPETRIFIGGAELETRFVSPQQLSTKVPAQLISFEGGREVQVRSTDGQLFSNTATINVMPAPVPNYSFIGVSIKPRGNDVAIVKEKNGRDLLNVQRGDILGGRFRVTGISVKELTLTDTSLNIKHKLPLVGDGSNPNAGGQARYPQPQPQPQPQPIEPPAEPIEVPEEEEPTEP